METKYGKRLANSPKLHGALQWIMAEAFELGYIPSINNTESKKLCLVLSNKDSGKVALLGTMYDDDGNAEVVAYLALSNFKNSPRVLISVKDRDPNDAVNSRSAYNSNALIPLLVKLVLTL